MPFDCWFSSVHLWLWHWQGRAVGLLPIVSLCYPSTMLSCFIEQNPQSNKFWTHRLFRDTHSMPRVDIMLGFTGWKSDKESTQDEKHTKFRVSLTFRSTWTHQTAKRGTTRREEEGGKSEIKLLESTVGEQLPKTLHRKMCCGRLEMLEWTDSANWNRFCCTEHHLTVTSFKKS